jgi:hypothetical protein
MTDGVSERACLETSPSIAAEPMMYSSSALLTRGSRGADATGDRQGVAGHCRHAHHLERAGDEHRVFDVEVAAVVDDEGR